ncbi:hypothetical protein DENIS_0725 [Desulfonema ishimotonii]|uniref:Cbb3-type cytochrome oxidase assembly protein CcoS n=1 Tax=Desulfonema ishimotonii TaxID=45657 RepID=A0A401FS46_9BACT|nr:hypothetical protein [Desulfonema ishimotonii]GBC59784.1 hypothetical protein DENIS_0725 [Desulfonema ishimotonii]
MYYPYFITYIVLGFAITIPVFLWALKSGQFRDQQRARFLPLEKTDETRPAAVSRMNRYEAYVLAGLALMGLGTSAGVVIFALLNSGQ